MKRGNRELLGTEVWIAEPVRKRPRLRRAAMMSLAALSLILASAAGATWVDLELWRDAAPQARRALKENRSSERQTIGAIAVLHRDIYESIELLRAEAQGEGLVAKQARIALEAIEKQAGSK